MSVNFWIKLTSALVLFGLAIASVQLYKSELIRDLRARFLRRKIVPLVQRILPLLVSQAKELQMTDSKLLGGSYDLMRHRADLEGLYQQTKPLFDQERNTIAEFLSRLSQCGRQVDQGHIERIDLENTVLLGQRVIHELTEIGL